MSKVALIGVFFHRPKFYPAIAKAIREQTRKPDELWLMCEDEEDAYRLSLLNFGVDPHIRVVPVARNDDGYPLEVPPSKCINAALDESEADYFVYLADDSLPHPEKIERMAALLDAGASVAYCAQDRGTVRDDDEWVRAIGTPGSRSPADGPQTSPYCQVDMTQVMHYRSEDRWPLEMEVRRIGDAVFWNAILSRFGAFQPVPEVLDWHRQLPYGITATW